MFHGRNTFIKIQQCLNKYFNNQASFSLLPCLDEELIQTKDRSYPELIFEKVLIYQQLPNIDE